MYYFFFPARLPEEILFYGTVTQSVFPCLQNISFPEIATSMINFAFKFS